MRHDRLPPIFSKMVKKGLEKNKDLPESYPSILINVNYQSVRKECNKTKFHQVDLYSFFWIESDIYSISSGLDVGFMCEFNPDDYLLHIFIYDSNIVLQDYFFHSVTEEGLKNRSTLSEFRLRAFNFVMSVMALMTLHKQGTKTSTFTASRNKGSVFYAEGDVTKFKRIFDFKKLPAPEYKRPEPGSSGIRKKEHDVIGHWRHYPSGAKVWVKPHKRGDPSLGRVTSVFS